LLDGRSLWFFDPASMLSVRISAQQRLIGQAAIGDILTVNLAVDYTAAVLATEDIQDAARQTRHCWHLDLKAASDLAVYNHVEYWVEQGTFFPIKGKFYSDSGRLLKILYFRRFSQRLGSVRPRKQSSSMRSTRRSPPLQHLGRPLSGYPRCLVPARLPASPAHQMIARAFATVLLSAALGSAPYWPTKQGSRPDPAGARQPASSSPMQPISSDRRQRIDLEESFAVSSMRDALLVPSPPPDPPDWESACCWMCESNGASQVG